MKSEIIKAPAGIGKTQLTAKKISNSANFPVEIYTPTHMLGAEWKDSLLKHNPLLNVVQLCGRAHIMPNGQPLCKKANIAQDISKAGLSVYPNLCMRHQAAGQQPLACEHYKECEYNAQFKAADVYIYPHSYITLHRTTLENWEPRTVIIDESFYQQVIGKVTLPAALLVSQHIPELASDICKAVYEELIAGGSAYQAVCTAERSGVLRKAIKALQNLQSGIHPELSAKELASSIKKTTPMAPIAILLKALRNDRKGQSVQYNAFTSEITVHYKKKITRFAETVEIKCIDASASKVISEALFDSVRFTQVSAIRNAIVTQCYATRCSTTSLVAEKNANKESANDADKRLKDIEHLILRKSENGRKVLVIGPQIIVGNDSQAITSRINIPEHCDSVHFNGFRGVDRWKDFDVVIVIGRNEPPVRAVEDMARSLYTYDYEPLLLPGEWTNEERGYYINGEKQGVEVTVHADARVQAIVEQLREEETLQAIDRLRLMHNSATKEVIILSNIPLDIDVNELRNWDDIIYGSRLERAITINNGILPLAPDWLTTNHSELWSTLNAAKSDVKRELQAFKKGQKANSIIVRKMTLFKYKIARQRRWSWCLSCVNDLAKVTSRLNVLLASKVVVKAG